MKKNIEVKVTMVNGSGMGLFINVNNENLDFAGSGSQNISCDPGDYIATVTGHKPAPATVTIQFIDNATVLASTDFGTPTFAGFIPFTVK